MARYNACIDMIKNLGRLAKNKKIIFIGHSHAGQIFAMLTLFLFDPKKKEELLNFLSTVEKKEIELHLDAIRKMDLKFLTLGTPPRYKWSLKGRYKVLHIINHRGNTPLGGYFRSAIFTKSGDYIQQWGIDGSDMIGPSKVDQEKNLKLDEILGVGANYKLLRQRIQKRNRFHNKGYHILVDFGDSSRFPNFYKTILGHGLYTKLQYLRFLLIKIVEY